MGIPLSFILVFSCLELTYRSLIHFEFGFEYNLRASISCICIGYLIFTLYTVWLIALCSLCGGQEMGEFSSGILLLFYWCGCHLSVCQKHNAFISVTWQEVLGSRSRILLTWFFGKIILTTTLFRDFA